MFKTSTMPAAPRKLLREEEAAELLDMSVKTLRNRRHMRRPPAFIRFGRKAVRYDLADLQAFIDGSRQVPATAE